MFQENNQNNSNKKKFFKIFNTKAVITLDLFLFLVLILSVKYTFFNISEFKNNKDLQNPQEIKLTAQKIDQGCQSQSRENCYKNAFTSLVKNKGFIFAEKTLYALQDIDQNLRHCHVLSHHIGNMAVRITPEKWQDLIAEVNVETCGAGFLHGMIEAHVGDNPDFEINKNTINQLCNQDKKDHRERTCHHIMGHLSVIENQGDYEKSLPACEEIDLYINQRECFTGIFMEDSFKLGLVEHGFATLPTRDKERMEKQKKRCFKYSGVVAQSCWIDLAEIFVELYDYNQQSAYNSCNLAPEQEAKKLCYQKAIILMAVSPNYDSKEKLVGECVPFVNNDKDYKQCIYFIVHSLMHYSPKFADRGIKLCNSIESKYKEYCFNELGTTMKMNVFEKNEREKLCSGTPDEYKKLCTG